MIEYVLKNKWWLLLAACALTTSIVYLFYMPGTQLRLTQEEQQWLDQHRIIRISPNNNFAPFEFTDSSGTYAGLSADILALIGKQLDVSFEVIRIGSPDERWKAGREKHIDLLGGVRESPERLKFFLFSSPIAFSQDVIVTLANYPHTATIDSLNGKRVAVPEGTTKLEGLRKSHPKIVLVSATSSYASLLDVSLGRADAAVVSIGSASYYILNKGLPNLKVAGLFQDKTPISFAVRNDWPLFRSILDKALLSIPADEREKINKKWLGLQAETHWWNRIPWQWIIGGMAFLALLAIAVLLWNKSLQHQVRAKTIELDRELQERRKTEDALQQSHNDFKELFENAPIGYHEIDAKGRIIRINQTELNMLGYTIDELLGHSILQLSANEDLSRQAVAAKLSGAFIPSRPYEREFRRKDGKIVPVLVEDRILKATDGSITGIRSTVQDITERTLAEEKLRESEERNRALIDASPSGILAIQDGRYVFANKAGAHLMGYEPDELINVQVFDLIHPESRPAAQDRLMNVTSGKKNTSTEMKILRKDGTTAITESNSVPISLNGEPCVLILCQDITERKRSEESLRQSQKLESIGTLAGGIAHDFNNILNAVLGQSSLALAKLPKESPAGSNISKAINAAERAADLTRQLLAYSGKGKFATENIDLNLLVNENVNLLEVSIPKTVQLRLELGSSSPRILGDVGQIQQVVMNLIINAGEAMGANPGSIFVRTNQFELRETDTQYWQYTNTPLAPGTYALLRVSDTGHGMKPEVLARIFDPFFTTKFTGRGLGLAAVLGIIRGHRGGVCIKSEEGKGTQFDVVFPIVESDATVAQETQNAGVIDGNGNTVLLIDDDAPVLELLAEIFTAAKFTVLTALNPIEGIELYRQHRESISIVILDYSMPGMDGKAAFDELVKINKDVRVLLCSGYTEEEMMAAFGTVRPAGFLHKPYKPAGILERVAKMLAE